MNIAMIMQIIFYIITVQLIFSLLCALFLFVQFKLNHQLLQRKNNHIVFILLILTFLQNTIEIPMGLIYLRTGLAANLSEQFCLFWIYCTIFFDTTGLFLMAYASFERYMFIFYIRLLNKYSVLFRYIPICLCFLYPCCYFIYIVFLLPCTNQFYYFAYLCSGGCYIKDPLWNAITWLGNICIPVFFILLANILLILRTIKQKTRMKQQNVWIKNRKMVLQLVSIGALYCITWLPGAIVMLIVTFPPPNVDSTGFLINYQYVLFMTTATPIFYPYVCLVGQPEIRAKIRQLFQRRTAVIPLQVTTRRTNTRNK